MNLRNTVRVLAAVFAVAILAAAAVAQKGDYRIGSPVTYKNLTIFLIHGKDQATKNPILTLQEAMDQKVFIVYETSNVNELAVENISKEFDVFIQSGDIVKGGKQDRIFSVSVIIPARSGRVLIDSFCVESGRWTKRGNEDAGKFTSSNDRVVTKDLKMAANAERSQSEVWSKVSEAQARLAKNVGGSVASGTSASSLQLSLENNKVVATVEQYVRRLKPIIDGQSDVIGFAFAINGKINSADIYVSNQLFRKLWPKMIKATATEAVSEADGRATGVAVQADGVKAFMSDADKATPKAEKAAAGSRVTTREDSGQVMFEARDEKSKVVVHRSYVKKD
jgi:hypothetical protein